MNVISVVGMAGAGKSEVAAIFEEHGFTRVRFGDITDREMERRRLEPGEESERSVRELLRNEHGMAAYAKLNLHRIDSALENSGVVIDGLYSWEEYTFLKDYYGDRLGMVAVWASPKTRYARLANREVRGMTTDGAASRDRAEIERVNKGGPIAMADFTIINESSLDSLREAVERIISGCDEKGYKKTGC